MKWYGFDDAGLRRASTLTFTALALGQVFHAFNARSPLRSAFTARLFTNGWLWAAVAGCVMLQIAAVSVPLLQNVLHTSQLSSTDWCLVLACASGPIGVVEFVKLCVRLKR
jgi:Ca2+-transporting ATPase